MGDISAIIGRKLQLLRELAGWTQEKMAANMGGIVGKEQIGRYERLGIRPKEEVIEAYAKALDLEPLYINQFISGNDLVPEDTSVTLNGLQVGSRIWKLRAGRNMFELAERAELFPEHWLRYELGQGPPSQNVCDRVAHALGCTSQEFLQNILPGASVEESFGVRDLQQINAEKAAEDKLYKAMDSLQSSNLKEVMGMLRQFITKYSKIDEELAQHRKELKKFGVQLKDPKTNRV